MRRSNFIILNNFYYLGRSGISFPGVPPKVATGLVTSLACMPRIGGECEVKLDNFKSRGLSVPAWIVKEMDR